jgi:ribonuclease Z
MAEKTKITFLGTGYAVPTKKRNHTSIYLQYKNENILIDCGEGTQRQFKKAGLSAHKVNRILITHWHGDHVLGLPGLLQSLALNEYEKTLYIYGPKGTKKYIQEMMKAFKFAGDKFNIEVKEVSGKFLETKEFFIEANKLQHGTPTNSYSFVLKDKIRINKEKLKKSKLPEGKHLSELQKGKDITYNGKKFKVKDLTYKETGKKISFVFDTGYFKEIKDYVKNSDILITESTYSKELEDEAKERNHLTAEQAGKIAKQSKSKKLFLTHISGRYENNFKKILEEAKQKFENTKIVKDLDKIEI